MSKKEPVIIMFDGEENYHTIVDLVCYNFGISIAAKAQNFAEAKAIFTQIENKKLTPEIAIVSGFLQKNHEDGDNVAKKLRELVPNIKIIAYTILEDAKWGDVLALKSTKDIDKSIISALHDLTKLDFKSTNVT